MKKVKQISTVFSAGAVLFTAGLHVEAQAAETIDVLVLYTPGTAERYDGHPETRINHLFNVTNQTYSDSNLDIQIRPVHLQQVDYPDSSNSVDALYDMTLKQGPFSGVDQLREEYGADMVVLYRPYASSHGNCGVAWIGGYNTDGDMSAAYHKSYMYSHISATTCADYVTAHELGHNMGLNHSRLQNGTGGSLDYGLGHGVQNNFVTIMAYQSAFNVGYWDGKVYKFSSPNLTCNGEPCGVDKNDPTNGADAVSALKVTTPQIASFFPTKVDDQPVDNGLSELERKIQELQEKYNRLLNTYLDALDYRNELKTEVKGLLSKLRSEKRAYTLSRKQYLKSRTTYFKAKRSYTKLSKKGSKKAVRTALEKMQTAKSVYRKKASRYSLARKNYVAAVKDLRTTRKEFRTAKAAVKAARTNMKNAKNQLLIAQKNYQNAAGVV